MSRKKLFIIALVFVLLILALSIFNNRRQGAANVIDEGTYDEYEYQPEYPVHQDEPAPEHEDESEPEEPEQTDPYEPYETTYELSEPPYESDTASPWHPIHFADMRAAQPLDADTPHGDIAVRHIRYINDNFYNRFPFSYQEKRAAAWIIQELLAMGYTWDDIEVQEFDWDDISRFSRGWSIDNLAIFGVIINDYSYLRNTYLSQNVILTVPGQSDQVIVIGAHYDSVLYPGASDNASGMALLLESAQRMRYIDNYYTLVYVFFGAEEAGLLGAHYYVSSLTAEEIDNIIFMINADVLFEGPYFIYAAGYRTANGTTGSNAITQQWDDIAYQLGIREEIILHPRTDGIYLGSDHLVFKDAGITVMMMFGAYIYEDGRFAFRVLHSYRDCIHYIMERWPYKIEDSMRTFSIFLEELLLARY